MSARSYAQLQFVALLYTLPYLLKGALKITSLLMHSLLFSIHLRHEQSSFLAPQTFLFHSTLFLNRVMDMAGDRMYMTGVDISLSLSLSLSLTPNWPPPLPASLSMSSLTKTFLATRSLQNVLIFTLEKNK